MIFHFVYNACPDVGALNHRNGPIFSVLTEEFLDILITATNPGLSIYLSVFNVTRHQRHIEAFS